MTRLIGKWWLAVLIALPLVGCGDKPAPRYEYRAADISGASYGRGFRLTDHTGHPRSLMDFRGKVVLLFFGYTHCPDVCPTTLGQLALAMGKLGEVADRVQVLFVTLDPARDKREVLAKYLPFYDRRFLGLYGDEAVTRAVAREFHVYYQKQDFGSKAGYSLDHTAGIYAFDPQGRLRLFMDSGLSVDDIVHDVGQLAKE